MVKLLNKWQDFRVNLGEIFDEATFVERSPNSNFHPIVVPVHVAAFVPLGKERKEVRRFEPETTANAGLEHHSRQ